MAQRKQQGKVAAKPTHESVPQVRSAAEHERQFSQLLDDAIFGVPTPKKQKRKKK